MSVRNVLKMMMSLLMTSLLAITFAATIAHAGRLDQSLASKVNVPNPNSAAEEAKELHTKLNLLAGPVEKRSGGGFIPYPECIAKCDECTICTRIYPIELAYCVCVIHTDSASPKKPALQNSEEAKELRKKLNLLARPVEKRTGGGGFIPYPECIANCDECTICTRIYPIELAYCLCVNHTDSASPKKPALQNSEEVKELHKKLNLLAGPVEKRTGGGGFIPYPECIAKCDECTICTRIYPIELAYCLCVNHTDSASPKKPALQNSEEAKELHKKLNLLAGPVEKRTGGGFIPYPECIAKCDECTICTRIYPIELAYCVCVINTDSASPKKPALQNSEEAKELHKKMNLLAGPVEKRTGGEGFIPYPECIAKCDECTICTRIYPIELAYCICVNHTDSASPKKPALQNWAAITGGDYKQMVLWTKAKMEASYEECIKTCEQCACTLPWPPGTEICICSTPKHPAAGGKALPM